jgi:hypothetical protein
MSNAKKKPRLEVMKPEETAPANPIPKPGRDLTKFKSKKAPALANVETLQAALSCMRISDVGDYVRLHPDEAAYWSDEFCFVHVPIVGAPRDTLHLIDEDLAMRFLGPKKIKRFRLALATKPNDRFFLCQVPTQNLENSWNASAIQACQTAKTYWVEVESLRSAGGDSYQTTFAKDVDAFPKPSWPSQSLDKLIDVSFRFIEDENHPGLLRLIGAKPNLA